MVSFPYLKPLSRLGCGYGADFIGTKAVSPNSLFSHSIAGLGSVVFAVKLPPDPTMPVQINPKISNRVMRCSTALPYSVRRDIFARESVPVECAGWKESVLTLTLRDS